MGERLTKDERCLGPGLAAYFVKGVLDRGIPMQTGANVEELIGDGERVVGVRATRDGKDLFVKANRGVVIAVSSYERNQDLQQDAGPAARAGLDGVLDDRRRQFPACRPVRRAHRAGARHHLARLRRARRGG